MSPWAKLASAIALGIGANTENLPVGLAYGLRGAPIGLVRNLLVAGLTTVATLVPMTVGRGLRGQMPEQLPDVVGGMLLAGLGATNIWIERRRSRLNRGAVPTQPPVLSRPSLRETLQLAGALSINNVGLGLAGGIAGLDYGLVGASVAAFSVLLLWLGEWLSRAMVRPLVAKLHLVQIDGNLLLVAAGILMMIGV